MVYQICFTEMKVSNGIQTKMNQFSRKSTIDCSNRKQIFDTIPKLNELRTRRWGGYLKPGETINCIDIEILEPVHEEWTDKLGKVHTRKVGMKSFTQLGYSTTYCRNCGRLLTDPVSVARGIGPECIKKVGMQRFTNQYLDEKIKIASDKMQKVFHVLDKRESKAEIITLIRENEVWMNNNADREALGYYLIRRFS